MSRANLSRLGGAVARFVVALSVALALSVVLAATVPTEASAMQAYCMKCKTNR